MQWRLVLELSGADGAVQLHEVHSGGNGASPGISAQTLGLTLTEAKAVLARLQRHLVQMQTEEHCQARRRCPRCGAHRPLQDRRPRRLRSLFGVVEVRAPRFAPCRCSVTLRSTLSPVTEIMPDRCTPELERIVAKLGALLPYRRARSLLADFFPIGELPVMETMRQRTLQVGARLERASVAPLRSGPPTAAEAIAVAIDCPSSNALRQMALMANGGFGPSGLGRYAACC